MVALALLLAGCKVDSTVSVVVRDDGSGVVRVRVVADAQAVKAAESGGVALEQAVRLTDLSGAGWTVGEWTKAADGSATILLTRRFASVDEVAPIIAGLNGENGPIPSLRATRDVGIVTTDYRVTGRIDPSSAGTGVAGDDQLVANLQALGVDVAAIDQQLLAQVQASFSLKVVVTLPGKGPVVFTSKRDSGAVDATASVMNTERILFAVAAVGFLALGVIVWVRGGRSRRRRGRRRGSGRGGTRPQASPRSPAPRAAGAAGRGSPTPGRRPPAPPPPRRRPPTR